MSQVARRLFFPQPLKVGYEGTALGEPGPGQVRASALLSGISHGTEMAAFLGTSPFVNRVFTGEQFFATASPTWRAWSRRASPLTRRRSPTTPSATTRAGISR